MLQIDLLESLGALAKQGDWSTRVVVEPSNRGAVQVQTPFLLIQKELCRLVFYSDRDNTIWVCSQPGMDDVFRLDRIDDNWCIAGEPMTPTSFSQQIEARFQAVKDYNEGRTHHG